MLDDEPMRSQNCLCTAATMANNNLLYNIAIRKHVEDLTIDLISGDKENILKYHSHFTLRM